MAKTPCSLCWSCGSPSAAHSTLVRLKRAVPKPHFIVSTCTILASSVARWPANVANDGLPVGVHQAQELLVPSKLAIVNSFLHESSFCYVAPVHLAARFGGSRRGGVRGRSSAVLSAAAASSPPPPAAAAAASAAYGAFENITSEPRSWLLEEVSGLVPA